MTDKERVLAKWPDAVTAQWGSLSGVSSWVVWPGNTDGATFILGHGKTEADAWRNAAERLE